MLGRHLVGHLELDFCGEVAHLGDDAGAGLVDVARDRAQAANRPMRRRHVAARLVDAAPRHERRRLGAPEPARRSAHVISRYAAELGDVLGRVSRYVGSKLVEAMAPLPHEIAVVQALGDDHVREAERKGAIRARLRRDLAVFHPPDLIGAGCGLGVARVDHHERHVRLSDASNRLPPERIVRLSRVRSPDEDAFRVVIDVGLDRPTERDRVHPDARIPANLPDAHVVRRAEHVHEAMQRPKRRMRPADHGRKRFRPILVAKLR